jgi:phosphatidylserine/phosphatidylglycerophosphate/cardiolipin synthase-like enzyme
VESPLRDLVERCRDIHFVRVLETGDEALLARIHLARAATRSICVQTFIWGNDEVGRFLVWELIEAAKRGVKVRVIVDQWVAALTANVTLDLVGFAATAHLNLATKSYNPRLGFDPDELEVAGQALRDFKGLNQRMHNKLFLVDDALAVTGGRNVENDYYDRGERRNYRDRDALVIGRVATEMRRSFDEYWASEHCVDVQALPDVAKLVAAGGAARLDTRDDFDLGDQVDDIDVAASDPRAVERSLVENGYRVRSVRFVADAPGKNPSDGLKGGGLSSDALSRFLGEARERLVLQSPYLVIDEDAAREVAELRAERPGVELLVSTNSLAATDNLTAWALASKQRKQVVGELGLRLFELKPVPEEVQLLLPRYEELRKRLEAKLTRGEPLHPLDDNKFEADGIHLSLHAKSYVVDGRTAWIGSFNLDPRSQNLNTEVGLVIEDEEVARAVEASILRDAAPGNSWTVAPGPESLLPSLSYSDCFDLLPGHEPVACFAPDFRQRYTAVGPYPGVSQPVGDVEMAVLQAMATLAEPIV